MTESPEDGQTPQRLGPPFPSRRELHGSRIPKRPEGAPKVELPAPAKPAAQADSDQQRSVSTPATHSTEIPQVTPADPKPEAPSTEAPASPAVQPEPPVLRRELHSRPAGARSKGDQHGLIFAPTSSAQKADPTQSTRSTGGERTRQKKRRRRRRGWMTAIIVIILVALVGGAGWWALRNIPSLGGGAASAPEDYVGTGSGEVQVQIEPGDTGYDIGEALFDAGVVKSVGAFTTVFESNAASASIRPGTYVLRKEMSAAEALAMLLDDANRSDNTVTVIPGQTLAQIEANLAQISAFSEADIAAATKDTAALGLPAVANGNLEGWLYPGSYEVSSGDDVSDVLRQMVQDTVAFLTSKSVPEDQWEKVLTEASIVEREVAWSEHMPQVARVVENRLNNPEGATRGKLQMDSTVLYGVGKSGGVPTAADIEDDNPYNTYLHQGLPPSPIASPSPEAIDAVLNPAEGDWLYFVTVNLDTGETLFADTLAQQQANTEKFMQWCEANAGKC